MALIREAQGNLASPYASAFSSRALDQARAASPTSQVRPDAPPFFIVHGSADPMAQHDPSVRLRAALVAGGCQVELEAVDGAEHFFEGCDDQAIHAIFDRTIAFMHSVTI